MQVLGASIRCIFRVAHHGGAEVINATSTFRMVSILPALFDCRDGVVSSVLHPICVRLSLSPAGLSMASSSLLSSSKSMILKLADSSVVC